MANTGRGSDRSRNNGRGTNVSTSAGMPYQKTATENSVLDRLGVITKSSKSLVGKLSDVAEAFSDVASDYLLNGGLNKTIHDPNALEGIQFLAQILGYEPLSLFGKNYAYIFDHVRRNYTQGMETVDGTHDWPKFTFYGDLPTVRFADVDNDPLTWGGHWSTLFDTSDTELGDGSYLTEYSYAESTVYDNEKNKSIDKSEMGLGYRRMTQFDFTSLGDVDLLRKTNDLFNAGKMDTLVARFHGRDAHQNDQIESAKSRYGVSHGRNLLKLSPTQHGDYDNPYCRVWTYYHQYSHINDMIRPFEWKYDELYDTFEWGAFRNHITNSLSRGLIKETDRIPRKFADNTVLNWTNGHVNIAPSAKILDYTEGSKEDDERVRIKKCMFSIENLAWKKTDFDPTSYDQNGLSPEQKGPFGGRIMWFPPYGINFGEDVQVGWNENEFIGRGENIYTYKNTRRTGRLSFIMLIDHPAILDYWDRKDRSGNSLIQGNQGGVDELHNEEQTLLRFFAGCDMLSAEPQKIPIPKPEPKEPVQPTVVTPDPEQVVPEPKGEKTIIAVLYYPNNYSGKDIANKGNAVEYLMNGIGTQRGLISNNAPYNIEEIPVNITSKVMVSGISGNYGGYEMRDNGISIVQKKPLEQPNMWPVERTTEVFSKDKAIWAGYDGYQLYRLTRVVGSEAAASNDKGLWYKKRYYTRVDKNTENQVLLKDESYIDGKSYKYNSTGYENGAKILGVSADTENGETLMSFSSLFVGLEQEHGVNENIKTVFKGLFNEEHAEMAKELVDAKTRILKVEAFGAASSHDNSARSHSNQDNLKENRAKTILGWLKEMKVAIPNNVKISKHTQSGKSQIPNNVDDPQSKAWRSAYVKITYTLDDVSEQKEQNARAGVDVVDGQKIVYGGIPDIDKAEAIGISPSSSNTTFGGISGLDNNLDSLEFNPPEIFTNLSREEGVMGLKSVETSPINPGDFSDDMAEKLGIAEGGVERLEKMDGIPLQQKTVSMNAKELSKTMSDMSGFEEDLRNQYGKKYQAAIRYDNEGEFFQKLTRESPIARHLISEKIKYFDPAFHSISPEGFNARLTFLHQCTRQGPTYANSDTMGENANNLAFGRPPVCILRLGDFYYTKIIINHIGINYDPLTWDLNQEGIGVMPMMAKIDINFNFIGGSDMTGPIARLQNAVSFNYYANASVYDNRAEEVTYDSKGKVATFKAFEYGREGYNGKGNTDDNPNLQGNDKKQ